MGCCCLDFSESRRRPWRGAQTGVPSQGSQVRRRKRPPARVPCMPRRVGAAPRRSESIETLVGLLRSAVRRRRLPYSRYMFVQLIVRTAFDREVESLMFVCVQMAEKFGRTFVRGLRRLPGWGEIDREVVHQPPLEGGCVAPAACVVNAFERVFFGSILLHETDAFFAEQSYYHMRLMHFFPNTTKANEQIRSPLVDSPF